AVRRSSNSAHRSRDWWGRGRSCAARSQADSGLGLEGRRPGSRRPRPKPRNRSPGSCGGGGLRRWGCWGGGGPFPDFLVGALPSGGGGGLFFFVFACLLGGW